MRFVIKEIILWLKNKKIRKLVFEENKINVITGDSGTGKSVILDIIDYCFFASKTKIPQEKINENVSWYGIKFLINDKEYLIARGALNENRKTSSMYFFSPIGELPEEPYSNVLDKDLKNVIEKEFNIDSSVVIPYGGRNLKAGSKISLRYFFLFNTQSGDTIDHSEVFFDKQNDDKYSEALHRVFDLATGIDTVKNILIKEKLATLEKDEIRMKRQLVAMENEKSIFESDLREIIRRAKEFDLIDDASLALDKDIDNLKKIVLDATSQKTSNNFKELDSLNKKRNELRFKIRSYSKFSEEYNDYLKQKSETLESLKPLEYLNEKFGELIQHPDLSVLMDMLDKEMRKIKGEITNKKPFSMNLDSDIKSIKSELDAIQKEINTLSHNKKELGSEIEKFIFIGEIKSKLELYTYNEKGMESKEELQKVQDRIQQLRSELESEIVDRELVIRLLEELIQRYLDESSAALGIYKGYQSVFDYKKKVLYLKKPVSLVPSIVGSSSNHMFMHLCFMLGLHELIIKQQAPFVPSFLILDQPSRPYYGGDKKEDTPKKSWSQIPQDDRTKITIALTLLNNFISRINQEYEHSFQIIILEHIPKTIWEEANLTNVILVDDEFTEGNALIPDELI
ncbi:DUF3732 domain-containing protein [Paenibacillus ginsengarvi]|uniref:DUF3732 domain-containing protein n=1 Tax=Paenibacillus ginsengarvi TaxID=400777 RepID=A0A3B0C8E3_9BACL|nr:DUF3732 domain-containing protein [Paenibacillus ginsengarvi]RKN79156.1 DUF3732 domain-containing protein [Paenibacillus ginsengarvi]